jgi:ribosomal protein S18 acetylase RimI-like enzyme
LYPNGDGAGLNESDKGWAIGVAAEHELGYANLAAPGRRVLNKAKSELHANIKADFKNPGMRFLLFKRGADSIAYAAYRCVSVQCRGTPFGGSHRLAAVTRGPLDPSLCSLTVDGVHDCLYLYQLHVPDTDDRGQGIGGAMLSALATYARAAGLSACMLSVYTANQRAVGLYARMGYTTRRTWPDTGRQEMWLDLGEPAMAGGLHRQSRRRGTPSDTDSVAPIRRATIGRGRGRQPCGQLRGGARRHGHVHGWRSLRPRVGL